MIWYLSDKLLYICIMLWHFTNRLLKYVCMMIWHLANNLFYIRIMISLYLQRLLIYLHHNNMALNHPIIQKKLYLYHTYGTLRTNTLYMSESQLYGT